MTLANAQLRTRFLPPSLPWTRATALEKVALYSCRSYHHSSVAACRCKTCVPRSMLTNLQLSAGKEVLGVGLTLPTMDILTSTPFDFSRGTSTELNQQGSFPKLPKLLRRGNGDISEIRPHSRGAPQLVLKTASCPMLRIRISVVLVSSTLLHSKPWLQRMPLRRASQNRLPGTAWGLGVAFWGFGLRLHGFGVWEMV